MSAIREATIQTGETIQRMLEQSITGEAELSPSDVEETAYAEFTDLLENKYSGHTLHIASEDQETIYSVNEGDEGPTYVGCLDPVDQTEKAVNGDLSHSVTNFWMGEAEEIEVDDGSMRSIVRPEYAIIYSLGDDLVLEADYEENDWTLRAEGDPYGFMPDEGFSFDDGDISDSLQASRQNLTPGKYTVASDYHSKGSRVFHHDTIKEPLNREGIRVDSNGGSLYQSMVATGQNHIGFESDPTKPTEAAGGIVAEAAGMERRSMLGNKITKVPVIQSEDGLRRTLHEVVWNPEQVDHPLDIINRDKHLEENSHKDKPIKPLEVYHTNSNLG
jgi:hypothetical protein